MKNKTQMLLSILWCLAIAGSRILYFFLGEQIATDTYEYFAHAMIQTGQSEIAFGYGPDSVYIEILSLLLRFSGNRIEAAAIFQMILQILWLLLIFISISMILGKLAGVMLSAILAALPRTLESIFVISPENFYLFVFSLILFFLAVIVAFIKKFCRRKKEEKKERQVQPAEMLVQEKSTELEKPEEEVPEEKTENSIITEDGRRVQLLENPLPLPKKHVRKEIHFDIEDFADDFDFKISDGDDFDL